MKRIFRALSGVSIATAGALLAGCVQPSLVQSTAAGSVETAGPRWTATLSTPGSTTDLSASTMSVHVTGTATMAPESAGWTRATVRLAGGEPGASYPWQVHLGRCGGMDGGIVGGANAYQPLVVGVDGRATGMALLAGSTPTVGDYMVLVSRSAGERGTVIACGDMTRAMARATTAP